MTNAFPVALLILVIPFSSYAVDEDLSQLRQRYEAAIERVTSPVKSTYLSELQRLKAKCIQESRQEDAQLVSMEIEAVKNSAVRKPVLEPSVLPQPDPGKKATTSEKSQIEKIVVRTLWEVKGARDFWWFDRSGRGTRKGPQGPSTFTWLVNDKGEITTKGGGDPRIITLRSDGKGEMLILSAGGERKAEFTLVPDGKEPR